MYLNINTQESELNDTNDADNINSQAPCHIQIERVDVMLRLLFWVILGIVCPVAGLVFWHAWKETNPEIAEAIAGGAITAVFSWVFYIGILFLCSLLAVNPIRSLL